ncbi:MAG: succinate dehydrogenase cytochrome b subunit [bacterium]|nr:succinate dehydrogenase cytochrome b subunit [bacterium]
MSAQAGFFTSSIGRKVVVAVTGVLLVLFVVMHLLGNLQLFAGAEKFNAYAAFLQSMGPGLWVARIGLVVIFLAHIVNAIQLSRESRAARPEGYVYDNVVQASAASRSMAHTGILVLVFVIVHLLHFTLGILQPEYYEFLDDQGRHDVYRMVVSGFQVPAFSLAYLFLMAVLGVHLSHGISSVAQTVGLSTMGNRKKIELIGASVAWLIALGYISLPVSVLAGIIR